MKDSSDSRPALSSDTISGILMILAGAVAIVASNVPALSGYYNHFIGYIIPIKIGPILIADTVKQWTQDALMVLLLI